MSYSRPDDLEITLTRNYELVLSAFVCNETFSIIRKLCY